MHKIISNFHFIFFYGMGKTKLLGVQPMLYAPYELGGLKMIDYKVW